MIILNVVYHCKSGKREDFYKALCDLGARKTSYEEGCVKYDYHFAAEDSDALLLLEKWPDQATLDFHFSTETFARLQELKAEYCENVELDKFVV